MGSGRVTAMRLFKCLSQEMHPLMVIAAILTLLSLAGVVLTFTSGLATSGIDGLFLLFVCLLTAAIFGYQALSQGGFLARFGKAHK
jgi:hypothetical protein